MSNQQMKSSKLCHISLLSTVLILGFNSTVQAENSILSNSSNQQKQWVGKPAPAFKLQDQNSKWHELNQYKGKWVVLYFYPKDNSLASWVQPGELSLG